MAKTTRPRVQKPMGPEHDYEAHEALHHLTRAEEIKRDSKLMQRAKKLADERRQSLARISRMNPKTKKG